MSTNPGCFPCFRQGTGAWPPSEDTDNGRLTVCTPFHAHLTGLIFCCLAPGSSAGLSGTGPARGARSWGRLGPLSAPLLGCCTYLCSWYMLLFLYQTTFLQRKKKLFPPKHSSKGVSKMDQLYADWSRRLLCSDFEGPFGIVHQDFLLLSATLWGRCCIRACCQAVECLL